MPGRALADSLRRGDSTATRITRDALDRIGSLDPALGAFLHVMEDHALARAESLDGPGAATGVLAGIPVAVKDNICFRDEPTTAGSRILEGYCPPYHAAVVEKLLAAGAVILGKTNLDEFSMGSSSESSAYGPVRNPWNPDRVPGGSSGGSAAAVAAGLVPVALGSDTGGSIRQPAAFCGVYGLKPTYGRVSRYGLVAYASSLDQIGTFARSAGDLETAHQVISGHDPRDATSAAVPLGAASTGNVAGLRIGLAEHLLEADGVQEAIGQRMREVAAALTDAGARVETVTLPDPHQAVAAYYLLAPAEASSNLARYDGVRYGRRAPSDSLEAMYSRSREAGFGPEVKRRILLGTYVLSAGYYDAFYGRAQRARAALAGEFASCFAEYDALLLPTTPTTAFPLGLARQDPVAMYLEDVFTVSANLTGLPAISVPAGHDGHGLPIGAQFMAPAWQETRLFDLARAVEDSGRWPVTVAPVAPAGTGS